MLGKLKVGQKIEVRITDVDVDRKRCVNHGVT
jgi:ribosomal protein S1